MLSSSTPPRPPTPPLFPYTTLFRSTFAVEHGARRPVHRRTQPDRMGRTGPAQVQVAVLQPSSEEHTSELQSRGQLVCRLLLVKKNHASAHQRTLGQVDRAYHARVLR